ncbi:MAG: hypothetical protein IKI97_11690 [Clostridia bacterium]|nr:hypothetical protein [Clostridia bacterium]
MKILIPILLALLLTLVSCKDAEKSSQNEKTPSVPTNAETANQQTENGALRFYIDGDLPDIGEFQSKPERYYKDYTPNFIPSKEYGRIIPFTGKYKIFQEDITEINSPVRMGYSEMGFCDENGKIIMDASSKNRYISFTESSDGFGFYTLSVTDQPEKEVPDDVYIPQKTYIIPESGEWCIELSENSWVNEAKDGLIFVSEYSLETGRSECVIYDYNGREISRIGNYDSVMLSECGLIGVMRWDDDNSFHGFLDKEGNVVLGPYKSINSFNSLGTAIVEEGLGFYLINTNGIHLTKAYANITEYKKDYKDGYGVYVARHTEDKNTSDVLSADGRLLGTITGSTYFNLRFLSDGDIVYYYTDFNTNKMVWKRLSDNSDFICLEYGKPSNKYSGNHDYFVYEDEENRIGCVFDASGETVLKIENFFELRSVSENGKYLIYSSGNGYTEYYDEDKKQWLTKADFKTYLYNVKTGQTTELCSGDASAYFIGEDERYVYVAYSEDLTIFGDFENHLLFDSESGKLIFDDCLKIMANNTSSGTYITVCGKNSCSLYDENLKLIIRTYNE